MRLKAAVICCMLAVLLAVVEAAPKSPWRKSKREIDVCSANIVDCNSCTKPGMQCVQCSGHRIISDDGLYCVECPTNSMLDFCKDVGKGIMGVAKKCYYGYRLDETANTCSSCITGCSRCDVDVQYCDVEKCFDGYAYNPLTKTCVLCPTLCANCSFPSVANGTASVIQCDDCRNMTYKSGVICTSCGTGCKKIDGSSCSGTKGCTACISGYFKGVPDSNGHISCTSCSSRCSACDSTGVCTACIDNLSWPYYVSSGTCQTCPELNVPNCKKCSIKGTSGWSCDECYTGYLLDSTLGTCSACADNCLTCKANVTTANPTGTLCETCPAGFASAVLGLNFKVVCDKCPDNCLACTLLSDKTTRCNSGSCDTGYTRNGDGTKCLACPSDCTMCEYDSATTKAVCSVSKCKARTVRNDVTKLCTKCPSDCGVCKLDSTQTPRCVHCDYSFGLSPVDQSCKACPSNCKACRVDINSNVKCQNHGCKSTYYVTALGKCATCNVDNCLYCKDVNKCTVCGTNYYLTSTFTCALIPTTIVSPSCPAGCKDCTGATCTTCTNTDLSPTASIMCLKLPACTDTTLVSRQLQCSSSCAIGHIAEQNVCHRCPDNCGTCVYNAAGKTMCNTCNVGYADPVDGLCQPCGSSCTACTGSGAGPNLCDNNACNFGYYFTNNLCSACDSSSNCKTCSSGLAGTCLTCYEAFRLDGPSSVCQECPFTMITNAQGVPEKLRFCKNCDTVATSCDTCIHGYIASSTATDKCISCPDAGDFNELVVPVCKTQDGRCKAGYVMDVNDARDCKQCPEGAAACYLTGDSVTPTKVYPYFCTEGYTYDASTQTCKACASNCRYCTTPGQCDPDGCINSEDDKSSSQTSQKAYARNPAVSATDPNICPVCAANCHGCATNGPTNCDSGMCDAGSYYKSSDMSCGACDPDATADCAECSAAATCTLCSTDFSPVLDGNNVITSCVSCAATAYCSMCATADTCTQGNCKPSYYWKTDATPPVCHPCGTTTQANPPGCLTCDIVGVCTTCGLNHVDAPTGAGICDACTDINCKQCPAATPANCNSNQCEDGYYLDDTTSQCASCAVVGCKLCSDGPSSLCTECNSGFSLASGTSCVSCTTIDSECKVCSDGSSSVCTECNSGFRLESGTSCVKVSCTVAPTASSKLTDLAKGQLDGTCADAATGCLYYVFLADGTSKYCPKGFCYPGHVWTSGNLQSPSGVELGQCAACAVGCGNCEAGGTKCLDSGCYTMYARTPTGTCESCPPGCKDCQYDTGLAKTVCKTTGCETEYAEVATNICLDCPARAQTCGNDTVLEMTSKSCDERFVLTAGGLCFSCPSSCKSCSFNEVEAKTTCLMCVDRYAKNPADNVCHACPNSCSACTYNSATAGTKCDLDKCDLGTAQDPNTMNCNSCQDTNCQYCYNYGSRTCMPDGCSVEYFYQETLGVGSCGKCTDNCNYCNNTSECFFEGCDVGYVRKADGQCQACLAGCKECVFLADNTTTSCLSCKTNYATKTESSAITQCQACPTGCNGCQFITTTSGSTVSCATCIGGYYKEPNVDGCTECGSNILTCTYATNQKEVLTCAALYGKNTQTNPTECKSCSSFCLQCDAIFSTCQQCSSKAYLRTDGTCNACPANCNSCDAGGCKSGQCVSMYRRYQKPDNMFDCQKCSDSNCLQCDADQAVCAVCAPYYYLDGTGCTKCPGNCPICDQNGCKTCMAGWIANNGQCAKCPFFCKECDLDPSTQVMKCRDNKCYPGYGLDETKLTCHDCATLTKIPKCSLCTDKDAATNKSSCLACVASTSILSDDNSTCLDCTDIDKCGMCIDRPRICSSCDYDLKLNRNKTICGTQCITCNSKTCPAQPKLEDVNYENITLAFCPGYCIVKRFWLMENEANKAPKKKSILYSHFGCSDELDASALIGSADCRQDSSRCADGPDNIEYCCTKGYDVPAGADSIVPMSLSVLLQIVTALYALMIHN